MRNECVYFFRSVQAFLEDGYTPESIEDAVCETLMHHGYFHGMYARKLLSKYGEIRNNQETSSPRDIERAASTGQRHVLQNRQGTVSPGFQTQEIPPCCSDCMVRPQSDSPCTIPLRDCIESYLRGSTFQRKCKGGIA